MTHCISDLSRLSYTILILGGNTCEDKFEWCEKIGTFSCNNPIIRATCRKRCGVCEKTKKKRTSRKYLTVQMKYYDIFYPLI